jgi:hypothetical protein
MIFLNFFITFKKCILPEIKEKHFLKIKPFFFNKKYFLLINFFNIKKYEKKIEKSFVMK